MGFDSEEEVTHAPRTGKGLTEELVWPLIGEWGAVEDLPKLGVLATGRCDGRAGFFSEGTCICTVSGVSE
jgi:hypothetical protein